MRLFCALPFLLICTCIAPASLSGETLAERAPRLSGTINQEALQRVKSISAPLISFDGTVSVRSLSPERTGYRYPVLRFAEAVRREFAEAVFPIGSRDYPLSIEIGNTTEAITTLDRRIFRIPGDFSQLIIHIPNPDTVSLDDLRTAIIEAQLREDIRALKGSYAALKLPQWFIEALGNASRDSLWRAEAYEAAHKYYAAGTLTTLDEFFLSEARPPKEVAACFAVWVLERNVDNHQALLTANWTPADIVGFAHDREWVAWFKSQEAKVFMPGLLTRSQFARWKSELIEPTSIPLALELSENLTRNALGKPATFRDLTTLYLEAYGAFATGDHAAYTALRTQADEACALLDKYFETNALLYDASDAPVDGTSITPSSGDAS